MERNSSTKKTLEERPGTVPIFRTLGLRLEAVSEGNATLIAPYDRRYDGIFESFHGELLMTLADTAACVAVLTLAGASAVITTTDMNIRFLAPCRSDCMAKATVIKFGKTVCPVSVRLCDANGTQVAVAQVTYMRLDQAGLQTSEEKS